MPDARFFYRNDPMTVRDCVRIAGAELVEGSAEGTIMSVADIGEDDLTGAAVYCTDEKRVDALNGRAFGLCIVSDALQEKLWRGGAVAVSSSPRLSFARLCAALYEPKSIADMQRGKVRGRVHESAIICGSAKIGDDPVIGPNVVIGPGVEIGDGVRIGANVTIAHTLMGNDVHILPGAGIGQAGFGFEVGDAGLERVPQLGRVIIGNHVDIGANTTIDRGALRDTVIADGVKIDNLVQIGHNVEIGEHSVIAAQTGISGSCVIGKGVFMGGKVGLTDHVNIGDRAKLAAGTGLMRDVPAGEAWGGRPGRPVKIWLKETAVLAKLARKKSERK